ncbi:MAG: phosphatase PAP2 family protein [Chloroflexota bacterium]
MPALTAVTLGAGLFLADTSLVLTHTSQAADVSAELQVHHDVSPSLHGLMSGLSTVGNTGEMIGAGVLLALVFGRRRSWEPAIFLVVAVGGAVLLESLIKLAVERQRPHLWPSAQILSSYSFPSGHSTGSAALAIAVIWLILWRAGSGFAWPVAPIVILFALSVGFSRVYLGVHWPTDVIGGESLSLFWVTTIVIIAKEVENRRLVRGQTANE